MERKIQKIIGIKKIIKNNENCRKMKEREKKELNK